MTDIHAKVPPLPNKMIFSRPHWPGITSETYRTVPSQQQRRHKKKQDHPKRMTIIGNLKIVPGLGNAPKVVPPRQRSISVSQDEMAQVPQLPRRMTIVGCPDQPYLREEFWKSVELSKVQPQMTHGVSQTASKVIEHCTQVPQDFGLALADTSTIQSPHRRVILSEVPEIPSEMLEEGKGNIPETTSQTQLESDEASHLQEKTAASSNMAGLTNLADSSDVNQQVSQLLTRMSQLGLQGLHDTPDTDLHLTQLLNRMSQLGLQDLGGMPKSSTNPLVDEATGTNKRIKVVQCLHRLSHLSAENIAEEDTISHQTLQSAADMQEVDRLPLPPVGIATPASSAETLACHLEHNSDGQRSNVEHQELCTHVPFCNNQSHARCKQTSVNDEQGPRKSVAETVGDLTPFCTQSSALFSLPVAACTRGLKNLQDVSPCNTDVNQTVSIDSLPTDQSVTDTCSGSAISAQEDDTCVNVQQRENPHVHVAASTVYSTSGSTQEGVNYQTARGDSQSTCLPVALDSALEVLLMEKCLQSWTVSGTKEHAVVVLRLTSPQSTNSAACSEQSCHHTRASLNRDDGKVKPLIHTTTSNGSSIMPSATNTVKKTDGFMHKEFDDESPVALCLPWFVTPQPFCLSKPQSQENKAEERSTTCIDHTECSDHFLYCYSSDTDAGSDPDTVSVVSLDWFEESLNLTLEKAAESQALPPDHEQSLHQPSFESEDETQGNQPKGIGGEKVSQGNADPGNIKADSLQSSQTSLFQYVPESAKLKEESNVKNITPDSEKHPCKENQDSQEHGSIDFLGCGHIEETPAHQSVSECLTKSDKERSVQTDAEKTCQRESSENGTHIDTASREIGQTQSERSHYESSTQSENSIEQPAYLCAMGSAESDSSEDRLSARGIDPHPWSPVGMDSHGLLHPAGAHENPCLLKAKSSPVLLRQKRSSGAEKTFANTENVKSDAGVIGEGTSVISRKILMEAGKPLRLSLRNSNGQLLEEDSETDEVF